MTIKYHPDGAADFEVEAGTVMRFRGSWHVESDGRLCIVIPINAATARNAGGTHCYRIDKDGDRLYGVDDQGRRLARDSPIVAGPT
jgi:hypothetical protein